MSAPKSRRDPFNKTRRLAPLPREEPPVVESVSAVQAVTAVAAVPTRTLATSRGLEEVPPAVKWRGRAMTLA
ncbi:unnamed protein product [Lampetra planeri]